VKGISLEVCAVESVTGVPALKVRRTSYFQLTVSGSYTSHVSSVLPPVVTYPLPGLVKYGCGGRRGTVHAAVLE